MLLTSGAILGVVEQASAAILSSKRGFADVGASYNYLQVTGAGWYYTWGTGAANPGNFDAKFIPMFWGGAPSQNTINNIRNNPNIEYVFGFNEPERPDQANLTVAQAISAWTTISNGFAGSNIKLVSPAVSDTSTGQAWLSSFMSQAAANNLRVDAVAFHWYGVSNPNNPAGAASSFLSRVDAYRNQYNKPVFITEFAIHDWGNAYSDEAIIEANRQFLNIVVPALESRSYVLGYAFYPWFSDGPMWTGNPVRPTPMAYTYVGALGHGQSEDIGGKNLGEHAVYLTGGEVTMTGATPGTVRYLSALENVSTMSGSIDWSLASGSNWVRIQPGATLRKAGANQITFPGGAVINNGMIRVDQGVLRIGASVSGNGGVVVNGGTLAMFGAGRLNTAPLVDVRAGGTLDLTGVTGTYLVTTGRSLNVERNGTVLGNPVAAANATISGGGAFVGDVTAATASIVRVGRDGAGVPTRFVIDNFESYSTGDVRAVASPPWIAHQDTSLADIESISGNKVLSWGYNADFRGTSRPLPDAAVLDNSQTATIFFRINSRTDDPDNNIGLADQAGTGGVNFGDFEAQLRMKQGTSAGTFAIDARNGGAFSATLASGLALNSWYNIWMVVNQATDTYDIYMNTGTAAATAANKLNATPLAFRNGTTSDLNMILAYGSPAPVDNATRVDDITFMTGFDLSNPMAGLDPGLVWTPERLTIDGNFTLASGAILELNLQNPSSHDAVTVTGNASIAGILSVTLAIGASTPQFGDVYDLFDFGSTSGNGFSAVNLPSLTPGLIWDTSNLLATGELAVIYQPGDFDHDGFVDGADYLAWQRGESPDPHSAADLAAWQAHYGTTPPQLAAAAPEPGVLHLSVIAATATLNAARRTRASLGRI